MGQFSIGTDVIKPLIESLLFWQVVDRVEILPRVQVASLLSHVEPLDLAARA